MLFQLLFDFNISLFFASEAVSKIQMTQPYAYDGLSSLLTSLPILYVTLFSKKVMPAGSTQ